MKLLTISIFTAMTSVMCAEKAVELYGIDRYWELVKNSPFTDPVEKSGTPGPDELPNWSLVGVRKYRDEQFVTVVNLKDRKQRVTIPGEEASKLGFRILQVDVARNFLDTKVEIQLGEETGWLEYDPKFLGSKNSPLKVNLKKETPKTQVPPTPGKRVRYVPRPQ